MLVMMRSMGGHAAASGPASASDRVTDLRRQLAELTDRQRRTESELAASDQAPLVDSVRAREAAPARDR